jgi:hypothetical protein
MPCRFIAAFDKNQSKLSPFCGSLKFLFRGRQTLCAFRAILISKDAEINGASVNLIQIHIIRTPVCCWQILKKEGREVPPQERIALDEISERPTFGLKFLLNTADKNHLFAHRRMVPRSCCRNQSNAPCDANLTAES